MPVSPRSSDLGQVGDRSESGRDAEDWNAVGESWVQQRRQRLWRRHSDRVTEDLVDRWLPCGLGAVLKTDLFDEALSEGLYPALRRHGDAVHGIDVAASTAHAAQRRHPGLFAHVADIRDLPFAPATFDAVISTSTLDHFDAVQDIDRSLDEISRVLAPGGRLVLTMDNPHNPKLALRARLERRFWRKIGLMPYHYGLTLAPDALRAAVEGAGLRVLESTHILHCPRISAVGLANLIERWNLPKTEDAFLSGLKRFEMLERLPSRSITGHFCAILAELPR